jgi:hypothetical protein
MPMVTERHRDSAATMFGPYRDFGLSAIESAILKEFPYETNATMSLAEFENRMVRIGGADYLKRMRGARQASYGH